MYYTNDKIKSNTYGKSFLLVFCVVSKQSKKDFESWIWNEYQVGWIYEYAKPFFTINLTSESIIYSQKKVSFLFKVFWSLNRNF